MTYTALPVGNPRAAVVSDTTTHLALKGLEEYTNYSILVFASTVKGDGNASDPIIVITDEDSKLLKTLRYLSIVRDSVFLIARPFRENITVILTISCKKTLTAWRVECVNLLDNNYAFCCYRTKRTTS